MPSIRVLIRDAPNMLRDILEQAISKESDIEVIPESALPLRAPADQSLSPDVVVVGPSESEPGDAANALLTQWPRSRVLMITTRGHRVLMYELAPRRVDLGEMSPDQLAQAIRSALYPERKPYAH